MRTTCTKCFAEFWRDEVPDSAFRTDQNRGTGFSTCCLRGAVDLPPWTTLPPFLRELLTGRDTRSRLFRENIRKYNSMHAFTSIRCDEGVRGGGPSGPRSFHIQGQLYHSHGPLAPEPGRRPTFAQIYFYDPHVATDFRMGLDLSRGLDQSIVRELTEYLHQHNPHVARYLTAFEQVQPLLDAPGSFSAAFDYRMELVISKGADKRRHNLPTAPEVAGLIRTEAHDEEPTSNDPRSKDVYRNLTVARRARVDGQATEWSTVHPKHPHYVSLAYPMMLPHGDAGYDTRRVNHRAGRDDMTLAQFSKYRMFTRIGHKYIPFAFGALFQQYLVDMWAMIDQERVSYLRSEKGQKAIRAELYQGMKEAVQAGNVDGRVLGRRIILPASHIGSRRYMSRSYHHSMAIVRRRGRPSLFITFTANPTWEDITRELLPGQHATDRPDIVSRVFHLKVKDLISKIQGTRRVGIFGHCTGYVYTIEYQKRGLPHLHMLLFLSAEDRARLLDPDQVDRVVCAEMPTVDIEPTGDLFRVVTNNMLHSPCGSADPKAVCMEKGRCSKFFPKPFQDRTVTNEDGYPVYRRRDVSSFTKWSGGRPYTFRNDRVVPYNPYLTLRYGAHVNVEVCAMITAVKYVHKYIYKGPDMVTVRLAQANPDIENDEAEQYIQCRYIGPHEAVWRTLGFSPNRQYPPVQQLAVHLPGQHDVFFAENATDTDIQEALRLSGTTLTAFFDLNRNDPTARHLLYSDVPGMYTWKSKERYWKRRDRQEAIGHMTWAHPSSGERYFLRLLLTVVGGPTSFEDLRTVGGHLYPTFKDACGALGLLCDDGYWERAITEAAHFASGHQLRDLLAIGITMDQVTDPARLWEQFCESFCDDLRRYVTERTDLPTWLTDPHLDYGLYLLRQRIVSAGEQFVQAADSLPPVRFDWAAAEVNRLIREERSYNTDYESSERDRIVQTFNADQRAAFERIVGRIEAPDAVTSPVFFLHGWGGTGKTYLYRGLCHYFRSYGKIVLCVASSGIAALLLPGGRTAHSRFKIPLEVDEETQCRITRNSPLGALLRETSLIVWDEVPMQHRYCIEAVSRTLQDVRAGPDGTPSTQPFGGIPVLFGGDFAQTLPIVRKGSRADEVGASLRCSPVWRHAEVLFLRDNMRLATTDEDNRKFAVWLRELSYDRAKNGLFELPPYVQTVSGLDGLYDKVFPPDFLRSAGIDLDALRGRVILCVQNNIVAQHNEAITAKWPGTERSYLSINALPPDDDNTPYGGDDSFRPSEEVLQSFEPAGLPPANLRLKERMPVMLLRNLSAPDGLCNGTRLAITSLHTNVIRARILGGEFHGREHILPRVTLYSDEKDVGIRFMRSQFPIRPCFAMTINKAQGQSIERVAVDLRTPAFSHGQFYVAMSRVTDVRNLTVLCGVDGGRRVENVVYPEALVQMP